MKTGAKRRLEHTFRSLMHDVHDILPVAGAAVLFQQRRDGLAGGFDVDGLEVALGVSISLS